MLPEENLGVPTWWNKKEGSLENNALSGISVKVSTIFIKDINDLCDW